MPAIFVAAPITVLTPTIPAYIISVFTTVSIEIAAVLQLEKYFSREAPPAEELPSEKEMKAFIDEAKKVTNTVAESVASIYAEGNQTAQRVSDAVEGIRASTKTLEEVNSTQTSLREELTKAQENNHQALSEQIRILNRALEEKTTLIESLHADIARLEKQGVELNTQLQQMSNQIPSLIATIEGQQELINTLQTREQELIGAVNEMAKELTLLSQEHERNDPPIRRANRFY